MVARRSSYQTSSERRGVTESLCADGLVVLKPVKYQFTDVIDYRQYRFLRKPGLYHNRVAYELSHMTKMGHCPDERQDFSR